MRFIEPFKGLVDALNAVSQNVWGAFILCGALILYMHGHQEAAGVFSAGAFALMRHQ